MPSQIHAGVYSGVRHYLQAVKDTGSEDSATVMAKMKTMSVRTLILVHFPASLETDRAKPSRRAIDFDFSQQFAQEPSFEPPAPTSGSEK